MKKLGISKYYISSFIWSCSAKTLNAVIGFISVPLLLNYFGISNYGILSIATAANGYLSLLDIGVNTGAIKFYSQWEAEGRKSLIFSVAKTSLTFYLIIGIINSLVLLWIAFYGEFLFGLDHAQFILLKECLIILSFLSILNWFTTVFNQLLIAEKKMAYTQIIMTIIAIFKILLLYLTLYFKIALTTYFLLMNILITFALLPYSIKCLSSNYIDKFALAFDWINFKLVLNYSLAIFALSIFQISATQSRVLILSIASSSAAVIVGEYRIIEVFPLFIITLFGTISSIILPKASQLIVKNDKQGICKMAYQGTRYISIFACLFCFLILINSKDILTLYVGSKYAYLYEWLNIWLVTVLIQIQTAPGNSLLLAKGYTKPLVIVTMFSCILSIAVNYSLCNIFGVGSAVVGYLFYVLINVTYNYVYFYGRSLGISAMKIIKAFIYPLIWATFCYLLLQFLLSIDLYVSNSSLILHIIIKSIIYSSMFILGYLLIYIWNSKIEVYRRK